MENASKALIIAAAVMIALMIVSIGLLLKWNLTQVSDSYVEKLDNIELQKYNNYFEIYEGRTNITAQEIITVIGITKQKNEGTAVWLKNVEITNWDDEQKDKFLSDNIFLEKPDGTVINVFECKQIVYNNDNKVIKIIFEKIN